MILSGDARTLWTAALGLNRVAAAVSGQVRDLPPLLFFTDPERTPRPWETAARLPKGAGVVYRHFGVENAERTAFRLREVTAAGGVKLLIGLDVEMADRVVADGVHLPERAISTACALRGRRPDWLLTAAVHSGRMGMGARDLDALVLSPVFRAGGASADRPALGAKAFADMVAILDRPVYALGGVGPDNVSGLGDTGACGIAAVESVLRAFGGEEASRI